MERAAMESAKAEPAASDKAATNGDDHQNGGEAAAANTIASAPSKGEKRAARTKNTAAASGSKPMTLQELDDQLAKEERAWKRARKEPKQVAYASEKVLEHDTAVAVGINANQLTEEEEGLLPPGTDEQLYTKVRNLNCDLGNTLDGGSLIEQPSEEPHSQRSQ